LFKRSFFHSFTSKSSSSTLKMAIFQRSIIALFLASAVVAVSAKRDVHDLATPFEEGHDVDVSAGGDNTFRGSSSSNHLFPNGRKLGVEGEMPMPPRGKKGGFPPELSLSMPRGKKGGFPPELSLSMPRGKKGGFPPEMSLSMPRGKKGGFPPELSLSMPRGKKGGMPPANGLGIASHLSLSMPLEGKKGGKGGKKSDQFTFCSIDFVTDLGMAALADAAAVEAASANATEVIEGRLPPPRLTTCHPCGSADFMGKPEGIITLPGDLILDKILDELEITNPLPIDFEFDVEISCGCALSIGFLPIWTPDACADFQAFIAFISAIQENPCGCTPPV
jgi:hypothetical protein